MYIAYMIQWWVFAVIMPVTWLLLIRREAVDRASAAQQAAVAGHDSAAGPGDSGGAQAVEQGGESLGGEKVQGLSDAVRR
jgi:hypothetical protein